MYVGMNRDIQTFDLNLTSVPHVRGDEPTIGCS